LSIRSDTYPEVVSAEPRRQWLLPAAAAILLLVSGNLTRVGMNAALTVILFLAFAAASPWALRSLPAGGGHWEPLRAGPGRVPLPLWLFAIVAVASALQQRTVFGSQTAMVYVIFIAAMALAALWATPQTPIVLLRWMRAAAVVGALGYLVTVALLGPGSNGFYEARNVGILAWLAMAVSVPLAIQSRRGLVVPALLVVTCTLSLSRTSTAVCLLLALGLALRPAQKGLFRRIAVSVAVVGVLGFLAVTRFPPLRDRFLHNDNESIAGLPIGTSGQSNIWRVVWDSIEQSPIYGHGVGTAMGVVSDAFGPDYIAHPHNDYLRLWHDFGILGLALWLSAMCILGVGAFRRWRSATNASDQAIHLAAGLGVIGLLASILTGNELVHVFVALPLGVVIGTSLGRTARERPQREPADHELVSEPSRLPPQDR
jgi:O-antigen ligase